MSWRQGSIETAAGLLRVGRVSVVLELLTGLRLCVGGRFWAPEGQSGGVARGVACHGRASAVAVRGLPFDLGRRGAQELQEPSAMSLLVVGPLIVALA